MNKGVSMKKLAMLLSILASSVGLKAFSAEIDSATNPLVNELVSAGITINEIQQLDLISRINPDLFEQLVKQDVRIKGKLKFEVLATGNKGGIKCQSPESF